MVRQSRVVMHKTDSWKDQVSFYRFWRNEQVTEDGLTEIAVSHCIEQCRDIEHLLLIEDTSEFNLERHRGRITDRSGLGLTGNNHDLGFFCHPTIAVNAHDGSPIAGQVTFTRYWNENQYITAGETAFTVVPRFSDELVGKALLPAARSGKVKEGQRVIVRFLNYPDQEFGMVNGRVSGISLVPSDNNYAVEIAFPQGLTTNYGQTLPVSHEMKASAEIVTEDLRLIERFFMPLRKALKEGINL